MQRYRSIEVENLTDQQLIARLRETWAYSEGGAFVVSGQLKEIINDGRAFFILDNVRHQHSGIPLIYPLADEKVFHTVFVGPLNSGLKSGAWVRAELELSPTKERKKHNNPFAMKAISGSVLPLALMDQNIAPAVMETGEGIMVEQWILDVARQNTVAVIEKEMQKAEQDLQHTKDHLDNVRESLTEKNKEVRERESRIRDTEKQMKEMEAKLSSLSRFIEEKTQVLIALDLVDESLAGLVTSQQEDNAVSAHDFVDVLGGDRMRLIAYIQAFMYQNGIMYSRSMLEDFLTLICSNDLIILAGDSGSGKTSMVKWFARAIGGKAAIIPVKPGWTSSDDLLGYYNPIEKKFLSTPFLDALLEASRNPTVPYFICLDEMNLARVEYYFADFLSLLEERSESPKIPLYSDSEANNLLSEVRLFLSLVDEARENNKEDGLDSFLDLMRDSSVNQKLHELCGFGEGDSLLRYHAYLRKLLTGYLGMPSTLTLPANVRIIGAINVDDTTHYLSPKILDRAHVIRFGNPLMDDWQTISAEVEAFDIDLSLPVGLQVDELDARTEYPPFDPDDYIVTTLLTLVKEYLAPMGIEFGLRAIRQAQNYAALSHRMGGDDEKILNRIILHKILPKLVFDGEKKVQSGQSRMELLIGMREYLNAKIPGLADEPVSHAGNALSELNRLIHYAQENDGIVNYWAR